jgi:hypothetical protein
VLVEENVGDVVEVGGSVELMVDEKMTVGVVIGCVLGFITSQSDPAETIKTS